MLKYNVTEGIKQRFSELIGNALSERGITLIHQIINKLEKYATLGLRRPGFDTHFL